MREKRETAEVFSLMKSFELKQVMHFQGVGGNRKSTNSLRFESAAAATAFFKIVTS